MSKYVKKIKKTEYIASISYGKDSLYMLEIIHENGLKLDRIVTADVMAAEGVPADFPDVVEFKQKADKIIKNIYNIEVEHLLSNKTFNDIFYTIRNGHRTSKKNFNKIYGFPVPSSPWCNSDLKMRPLRKVFNKNTIEYVGYALNEKKLERQKKIKNYLNSEGETNKIYPLVDFKCTEEDAYNWCEKNDLLSPTYSSAERDGCWFCPNQKLKSLYNLSVNYPEYWKIMLQWEEDSPTYFRKDCTLKELDKRFSKGFIYKPAYKRYLKENR